MRGVVMYSAFRGQRDARLGGFSDAMVRFALNHCSPLILVGWP